MHVPQNHDPRWDDKIPDTPFARREGGGTEFAAALMEMDDEMGMWTSAPTASSSIYCYYRIDSARLRNLFVACLV